MIEPQPRPTDEPNVAMQREHLYCPRCGYDVRGQIRADWETDAWPLQGRCSECGLEFAWGSVILDADHPWLFENNWRVHPVRRFARTWKALLRPARFWRTVELHHPIHFRMLCFQLILVTVPALLIRFLFLLYCQYARPAFYALPDYVHDCLDLYPNWWATGRQDTILSQSRKALAGLGDSIVQSPFAVPLIEWCFLLFFVMFLLPITMKKTKIRNAHLLRVMYYSLILFVPLVVLAETCSWAIYWMLCTTSYTNEIAAVFEGIPRSIGTPIAWVWESLSPSRSVTVRHEAPMIGLDLIAGVLVILFWWNAFVRYLKLPQPRLTFALLLVPATLFIIALSVY